MTSTAPAPVRHRDLPVPAGTYAVLSKSEYHPFEQRLRAVVD